MKNSIQPFVLFMLVFQFPLVGQMCLPEGIHFTRQSQIDSFSILYPGCTEIGGDVCIGACQGEEDSDITNLDGLMPLTSIKGKLNISNNYLLTSIEGLQNLSILEDDVKLKGNYKLSSLKGSGPGSVDEGIFYYSIE
ncbi:MAG: hypothetical protein IPP25_10090 [Saprospiraceae bacterium]|nr:hypothetical protein [Candidatus Opimibacter skivensis]